MRIFIFSAMLAAIVISSSPAFAQSETAGSAAGGSSGGQSSANSGTAQSYGAPNSKCNGYYTCSPNNTGYYLQTNPSLDGLVPASNLPSGYQPHYLPSDLTPKPQPYHPKQPTGPNSSVTASGDRG